MEIYEYSSDVKPSFSAAVVALGLFDGVHLGHRALLATAKAEAEKRGLPLVVFTFFSENELPKGATRLYSTEQKNELLKKAGAEYVVYADFGKIANLSAKSFVFDVLVDKLKAQLTVAGLDFRFGKGREGDAQTLAALMAERGGKCLLVPDESAFGAKVSTSLIKDLLKRGEPELAGKLLGEPYFIEGTIVRGDGRGRTLGLPTVNISLPSDKAFIKHGVYCGEVLIDGKTYTGLTNIGKCPTFEERKAHAESFILDFSGDVYGKRARIQLAHYLREERRFDSKEALIEQINDDITSAKEIYKNGR